MSPAVAKAIVDCAHGAIDMISPETSPRRRGTDHSIASGIAEVYSPARKAPPTKRSTTTEAIASAPMLSWVGTAAMPRLHTAVPAIATLVVRVRPSRSESCPKTIDPRGRPSSVATMTRAPVVTPACGPASVTSAGASATTGRKMLIWST